MSDKTEQPTPKRLRESREKGDVCKSQDVPSALTVLALSVYIVVMGGQLLESLPGDDGASHEAVVHAPTPRPRRAPPKPRST